MPSLTLRRSAAFLGALVCACSGSIAGPSGAERCQGVTCSGHGACDTSSGDVRCDCDAGWAPSGLECLPRPPGSPPAIAGCQILPSDHLFNTPIDGLPVHPSSAAFMSTIGARRLHLDLGTSTDMTSEEYWGIPYNVVHGNAFAWTAVRYFSADPDLDWDPRAESDCASGTSHGLESPCTASQPLFPIPASPLVEGGIDQPSGDHHLLILDADTCRLWELYHCYPGAQGGWDIFGSATFDLRSNALRPAGWTSADAAGFPMLPLLLRASEASLGEIRHALRFTLPNEDIRGAYTWPARHLNTSHPSTALPPMGQLFRIKPTYQIPTSFGTQARAILQAMKTYGMYLADGGSAMFVQGEPSAGWEAQTIDQVQSVGSDQFEAVDLGPITRRAGFDPDSAAVPAP